MNTQNALINLRTILAELYRVESSAIRVAMEARLNVGNISFTSKASDNWHAILEEACKANQIDPLLKIVRNEYPENLRLAEAYKSYCQFVEDGTKDSDTDLLPVISGYDLQLEHKQEKESRLRNNGRMLSDMQQKLNLCSDQKECEQLEDWIRNLEVVVADQEAELAALAEQLNQQDSDYQMPEEIQALGSFRVLERGEVFHHITDATLYLDQVIQRPGREIQSYVQKGQLIPPKYIYSFPHGADLWIQLCNAPLRYRYYADSIRFLEKNKERILSTLPQQFVESCPDYISLGCGNGRKDRILLEQLFHMSERPQSMAYYYPYDISVILLSEAIKHVCRSQCLWDRIKIKAIEADFESLPLFKPVYQYRSEPNIFALLGNTLGNLQNEADFLSQVRAAMLLDDILLVEVRLCRDDDITLSGDVEEIKEFDFTPLRWLGVPYESKKLNYEVLLKRGSARDAITLVATYHDFMMENEKIDKAVLSYVHLYKPGTLVEVFENEGFSIVDQFSSKSTELFVLKPAS